MSDVTRTPIKYTRDQLIALRHDIPPAGYHRLQADRRTINAAS